jgi:hypothetical protein
MLEKTAIEQGWSSQSLFAQVKDKTSRFHTYTFAK